MSEKYTSIWLAGSDVSFGAWGHLNVIEMLTELSRHIEDMRKQVEAYDAAKATDFRVETMYGPHARRNLKVIQEGRKS